MYRLYTLSLFFLKKTLFIPLKSLRLDRLFLLPIADPASDELASLAFLETVIGLGDMTEFLLLLLPCPGRAVKPLLLEEIGLDSMEFRALIGGGLATIVEFLLLFGAGLARMVELRLLSNVWLVPIVETLLLPGSGPVDMVEILSLLGLGPDGIAEVLLLLGEELDIVVVVVVVGP